MAEFAGNTGPQGSWEETYAKTPPGDLPWNAGMADGDLRDLVETGSVPKGRAYDLGCGPGHDAVYLSQSGWDVTAVDLAPSAIALARETARAAGVESKIHFQAADVLSLKPEIPPATLVHDRGCFHTLPSNLRAGYVGTVAGLLGKGGVLALKVFSFKEPQGRGPYRFTPEELKEIFGVPWECLGMKEGVFHGPRKPFSLFCVFRKG